MNGCSAWKWESKWFDGLSLTVSLRLQFSPGAWLPGTAIIELHMRAAREEKLLAKCLQLIYIYVCCIIFFQSHIKLPPLKAVQRAHLIHFTLPHFHCLSVRFIKQLEKMFKFLSSLSVTRVLRTGHFTARKRTSDPFFFTFSHAQSLFQLSGHHAFTASFPYNFMLLMRNFSGLCF